MRDSCLMGFIFIAMLILVISARQESQINSVVNRQELLLLCLNNDIKVKDCSLQSDTIKGD